MLLCRMSSWIGITPNADVGQPSFFQEDFSHILQEHGLNEFVNLLGIADHTHFNTFQSMCLDAEGACSINPEPYDKPRSDIFKDQSAACDVSDSPACLLSDLCTETPKQLRGASPNRLDYLCEPPHSAIVGTEAKRRRVPEPTTEDDRSISGNVSSSPCEEWFPSV